jgi:maltooligosyltrehalose trehalohydrolase
VHLGAAPMPNSSATGKRLAGGAEYISGSGVQFRVWAPEHKRVELVIEGSQDDAIPLRRAPDGYFSTLLGTGVPGLLYRYRLDGQGPYADPMSRFQPKGPNGPSEVIAPDTFAWSDAEWRGIQLPGQVFYEVHVGTFTEQGTWLAAQGKLPHLRELGITCIELMPIGDFAGEFGWGYDGVNLFAPHRHYGRPDELRAFVNAAHQLGLGVILDVVYNHVGPSGNYLPNFSPHYFSKQSTEWGDALNFDAESSQPVRNFVCDNVAYWIAEFHLDGFRLDATQSIFDSSPEHIITALTRRARETAAALQRSIVVIAENEQQAARLARPAAQGGYGIDGLWNDDFHHSACVALTGRREAYYTDYLGKAQEFTAAAKHGFLYQGQYYSWQKKSRGAPTRGLPARAFVAYLENHDQVANTAFASRLWLRSNPGAHRAMTTLLLLGPWTPLLFQGQEWSTPQPFPYFADHETELAREVHKGRREQIAQFPSMASQAMQELLPDPGARLTFESAKLDWTGQLLQPVGQHSMALHRDLLHLRGADPTLRAQNAAADSANFDGAALSEMCLVLRWFSDDARDRLLVVNLGADLLYTPAPEPLIAPPEGHHWKLSFSSEDPRYGGGGTPDTALNTGIFRISARSALLLSAAKEGA